MRLTALSQGLGKLLFHLHLPQESLRRTQQLLSNKELRDILDSPIVSSMQKGRIIEALFEPDCARLVRALCQYGCADAFDDIFESYHDEVLASRNWLRAKIVSARPLAKTQLESIKASVCEHFDVEGVELEEKTDPALLGGFVLTVGDLRYDQSVRGRMKTLTEKLVRG